MKKTVQHVVAGLLAALFLVLIAACGSATVESGSFNPNCRQVDTSMASCDYGDDTCYIYNVPNDGFGPSISCVKQN